MNRSVDDVYPALSVLGARCLLPDGRIERRDVHVEDGRIAGLDEGDGSRAGLALNGEGLLALPGIVDVHGDAFERQLMPRPGVDVAAELALQDTDRQMLAAGITTAMHGVTYSFEPGLRGRERCVAVIEALERTRPRLGCDTRIHLRIETFNVDAEEDVLAWIEADRLGALAYNDHTPHMLRDLAGGRRDKLERYGARMGLDLPALGSLLERVGARAPEVPAFVERLAAAARSRALPQLSHDDDSPAIRDRYHALGCAICEFPMNRETAARAREAGAEVVLGAPNVMRGGSHNNAVDAAEMVAADLCSVLASDYYYPAMLDAAFRLHRAGTCLADAWALVSAAPARALGLADRGSLAAGLRADLVLVENCPPHAPRVAATVAAGRPFVFEPAVLARAPFR